MRQSRFGKPTLTDAIRIQAILTRRRLIQTSRDRPFSSLTRTVDISSRLSNPPRTLPYNDTDPFLQAAGRKELLVTKLQPPAPEMEPDSKLVVFDIVLYVG